MEEIIFAPEPFFISDGEIFAGDGARGYVENGIVYLSDEKNSYEYKNGEWWLNDYRCGLGACPVLQIENLKILDLEKWNSILYIPFYQEN